MRLKDKLYLNIGGLVPAGYRTVTQKMLLYAGLGAMEPAVWLGMANILALFTGAAAGLLYYTMNTRTFSGAAVGLYGILGFIAVHFVFYIILYFKVQDRKNRIEQALPDALQLLSANLKAGMTPFEALKSSQREEFGPLKEEMDYATKRALGTESFSSVLLRIADRVDSETLDRTMKLFTTSIKSGGRTADLLEEIAKDIAETRQLKKEFMATTKTYAAFIMFTIVIGAPLLLAISIEFVQMITKISSQAKLGGGNIAGLSLFSGEIVITPDFLFTMSIILMVATSVLASMLIGVIKEGKPADGFKSAPIIAIVSIIGFYIFRHLLSGMF